MRRAGIARGGLHEDVLLPFQRGDQQRVEKQSARDAQVFAGAGQFEDRLLHRALQPVRHRRLQSLRNRRRLPPAPAPRRISR